VIEPPRRCSARPLIRRRLHASEPPANTSFTIASFFPNRWGAFGDDGYEELDAWVAFRLGLKTWANWVDANIDPNATRVFFMSISTTHMR